MTIKIKGSNIQLQVPSPRGYLELEWDNQAIDEVLLQFQKLSLRCLQCSLKATGFALDLGTLYPLCDDCSFKDCVKQLEKRKSESKDNDCGEFGMSGDWWKE